MKVAIITANTAVYKGNEEDASGKVMKHMLDKEGHEVVFAKALPGDRKVLATVMQRMADAHLTDLILTTGGAGCAMGDCTPEATIEIADRLVPGIPEAMRAHMMQLTKRAMLNRCAAGIRGDVLIVNLPGKAGAVKECVNYLLPELVHTVEVLKDESK